MKSEPNSSVISNPGAGAASAAGGAAAGAAGEMYVEGGAGEEGYAEDYAEEDYSYAGGDGYDDSSVMGDPNMSQGSAGVDGNKGRIILSFIFLQ